MISQATHLRIARGTEEAATALAARREFDNDLRFTVAASHCGEAADELQRAHPDVGEAAHARGFTVDFRVAPIDEATGAPAGLHSTESLAGFLRAMAGSRCALAK